MTDDVARLVVVDAANVVGSRPDGWWRDRAGAARRLIAKLVEYQGSQSVGMVVVVEGAARPAVDGAAGGVRVVAADGSGDDAIVAVVADAVEQDGGLAITVVTADRGLRERVEALGATTVGPRWLWDRLD